MNLSNYKGTKESQNQSQTDYYQEALKYCFTTGYTLITPPPLRKVKDKFELICIEGHKFKTSINNIRINSRRKDCKELPRCPYCTGRKKLDS